MKCKMYLRDSLVDVEDDEGGRDEGHGEDDADGVQQTDADLATDEKRNIVKQITKEKETLYMISVSSWSLV